MGDGPQELYKGGCSHVTGIGHQLLPLQRATLFSSQLASRLPTLERDRCDVTNSHHHATVAPNEREGAQLVRQDR